MGIESWFSFESAKEKKKREARYFKKMYPFGEEQRDWQRDIIKRYCSSSKKTEICIFESLILKEALIDNALEDEEDRRDEEIVIQEWDKKAGKLGLNREEIDFLKKIVDIELHATSIEQFLSIQDI